MGIYTNGDIFGIIMYTFNSDVDDTIITLFKNQYDVIMTNEQKKEAYTFYNNLIDKNDIRFKFYTECTSTHELQPKNFMNWYPMSLDEFLDKFNV